MEGRIYRTAVSIKDFGERARIDFIAAIGKALREWALAHTKIGPKRRKRGERRKIIFLSRSMKKAVR